MIFEMGLDRTHNLLLSREAPYPLGHTSCVFHSILIQSSVTSPYGGSLAGIAHGSPPVVRVPELQLYLRFVSAGGSRNLPLQVEGAIVNCKNCKLVIWGQIESCCSKTETSALPHVLWVPVEVEISPCNSNETFRYCKNCHLPDSGQVETCVPAKSQTQGRFFDEIQ